MKIKCIHKSSLYNKEDLNRFNEIQTYFGWSDSVAETKIGTWMSINDTDNLPTIENMNKYFHEYGEHESKIIEGKQDYRLQAIYEKVDKKEINIDDILGVLENSQYVDLISLLKNNSTLRGVTVNLKTGYKTTQYIGRGEYSYQRQHRAYYNSTTHSIDIYVDAPYSNGNSSSVLMHEIMHALTINRINKVKTTNPDLYKELQNILKEYRKAFPDKNVYHKDINGKKLTEDQAIKEFIADIWSNPNTIKSLQNIPTKTNLNLWNKVKLFLTKLLTPTAKEQNLFQEASINLVQLLEEPLSSKDFWNDTDVYGEQETSKNEDNNINTNQENTPIDLTIENEMRQVWTPQTIQNRAIRIIQIFKDIVTDLENNLPELEQLNTSSATRKYIITVKYGAGNILQKVKDRIRDTYANNEWVTNNIHYLYDEADWNSPEVLSEISRIQKQGELMLKYFEPICSIASSEIKRQEGVSILTKDGEVVDLSEEENLTEEEIQQKHEEGWFYEPHEQSVEETLQAETVSILANLFETDSEGNYTRFDDLEEPLPIDFRMALATTAKVVGNCTIDSQMIPALKKASARFPWMQQIVDNLLGKDSDVTSLYVGLSDEDKRLKAFSLQSIFWKDLHKIFVNISEQRLVEEKNGSRVDCSIINRSEGADALMKNFENICYNNRTQFNSEGKPYKTVYNFDGSFDEKTYDSLHKLLMQSNLYYRIPDFKINPEDITLIDNLLKAFGTNINKDNIAILFDTTNGITDKQQQSAQDLKDVLFSFYNSIKANNEPLQDVIKDKGTTNIFDAFNTTYRKLADIFSDLSVGYEESQARLNIDNENKSLFSRILPNPINTIVNKLKNIDGLSESNYRARLQRDYGHNWWFAPEVDQNGNGIFRKGLLNDLLSDPSYRKGLRVSTLKASNGISYNHEIDAQAEETRLNQFENTNEDINGLNFRDYSVPTFSDAPESYFISMRYFNIYDDSEREQLLDRLCDVVRQEIDRINVVNARTRINKEASEKGLSKPIQEIAGFDENGTKFFFLPELNNNQAEFFAEFNRRSVDYKAQQEFLKQRIKSIIENEFEYYLEQFNKWQVNKLPQSRHAENEKSRKQIISYIDTIVDARKTIPLSGEQLTVLNNLKHQLSSYTFTKRQFKGKINDIKNILTSGITDENWNSSVRSRLDSFELDTKNLDRLRDYFYNTFYAQTQVINITMIDPSFLGSNDKFQKRYKMFYSPVATCYTSEYYYDEQGNIALRSGEDSLAKQTEYSLVLQDDVLSEAFSMDNVTEAIHQRVRSGQLTKTQGDLIISNMEDIVRSDAQCYRTLPSWQKCLNMIGKGYNKKMQQSINKLTNPELYGEWTYEDYHNVWEIFKPFVASYASKPSMVDTDVEFNKQYENIETPIMHKNSEFLLLAMYPVLSGVLKNNWKLKALNEFMVKHGIDKAQFESAVKVGIQAPININSCTTPEEVISTLEAVTKLHNEDQAEIGDKQVITATPFRDWGISTSMPEHLLEHEESAMGTQIMKIIMEGLAENPNKEVVVNGKTITYNQWLKIYQALHTQNIMDSFAEVGKIFNDTRELSKYLKKQILTQNKYSHDLLAHLELDDDGNFKNPIIDPILRNQFDALLASLIRNNVTKRMMHLGALPQVASYGFGDLQLRFKDEFNNIILTEKEFNEKGSVSVKVSETTESGITETKELIFDSWDKYQEYTKSHQLNIAYMEVYLPPFDNNFMSNINDLFIYKSDVYEDGKLIHRSGEFNMSLFERCVDKRLLEGIANRVPTETKHSMIPIYIKGFLPSQNSSCVMVPAEWIAISDSDNDGDKLYCYFYNSQVVWDYNKIKSDWAKHYGWKYLTIEQRSKELDTSKNVRNLTENYKKSNELDLLWDEVVANSPGADETLIEFKRQAELQPEKYLKIKPVKFNINNIEKTSNENESDYNYRSIMASIASNNTKARNNLMLEMMHNILQTDDNTTQILIPGGFPIIKQVSDKMKSLMGINDNICSICNPAVRTSQQVNNMAGKNLVGIYANHRSFRPLLEQANVTLHKDFRPTINGNISLPKDNGMLTWSLSSIKNNVGDFISDNISNFSGASVDNAKDPRLGWLGQNEITAPITMLLIHLGYTIEEAATFMNQPSIKRCVRQYLINGRKGFLADVVNSEKEQMRLNSFKRTINDIDNLPLELLEEQIKRNAMGIIQDDNDCFIQFKVLENLSKLLPASQALQQVLNVTKADTQVGALSSRSSENKIKLQQISRVSSRASESIFPIVGAQRLVPRINNETDVNSSSMPYISAFRYYGIESIRPLMKDKTMTFNDLVDAVHNEALMKIDAINLDADTIDGLTNATVSYLFSSIKQFNGKSSFSIVKNTVDTISEIKRKGLLKENILIRDLTVNSQGNKYSKNFPFVRLNRNNRKNIRSVEVYQNAWMSLIANGNQTLELSNDNITLKQLSDMLFDYCFAVKGLGTGGYSFLYCFPTSNLNTIAGYQDIVNKLNDLSKDRTVAGLIVDQYVANNPQNYHLVHRIDSKKVNIKDLLKRSRVIPQYINVRYEPFKPSEFYTESIIMGQPTAAPHAYITFNDDAGRRYLYKGDTTQDGIMYSRMQVLGNTQNGFLEEYQMGKNTIFGDPYSATSAIPANSNIIFDADLKNDVDNLVQQAVLKGEKLTQEDYLQTIKNLLGNQQVKEPSLNDYVAQKKDSTGMNFCITI